MSDKDQPSAQVEEMFVVDGCSVTKDGQCALHGVEIERRRSTEKDIALVNERLSDLKGDIKKDISSVIESIKDVKVEINSELETHTGHIGDLLSYKNIAVGLAVLLGMVLTGAYAYTYIEAQSKDQIIRTLNSELDQSKKDLSQKIEISEREISNLKINIETKNARTEERYIAMTDKLSLVSGQIRELVDAINHDRIVQREQHKARQNGGLLLDPMDELNSR